MPDGSFKPKDSLKIGTPESAPIDAAVLSRSKVLCVLPWQHLNIRSDGKVFPCCAAHWRFPVGSLHESSIQEIWNSSNFRRFRLNMLEGKENPHCTQCYEQERNGFKSIRQQNQKEDLLAAVVESARSDGSAEFSCLRHLHVEPSNACNFKCRYCDSMNSTAWFGEQSRMEGRLVHPVLLTPTPEPKDLARQIRNLLSHLKRIQFSGGEPLISQGHHDILSALMENRRFDVSLAYITNFSTTHYRDTDFLKVWAQFRSVSLGASLDGVRERGEYIRKNQRWDRIVHNRERLMKDCPDVYFYIGPTLSVMNVLHFPDFHREWLEKGFIGPWNMCLGLLLQPEEYRVQVLPASLKARVAEKYEKHIDYLTSHYGKDAENAVSNFRGMLTFMNGKDLSSLLGKFRKRTRVLDSMRGERFENVFPELSELMREDS